LSRGAWTWVAGPGRGLGGGTPSAPSFPLSKEGIAFEPFEKGILSCAEPQRLQEICDGLSAAKIYALLRKWLAKLPDPYTAADCQAGYRYDISILQAEFSLARVLDRKSLGPLPAVVPKKN
jgi:hypothetical protein